MLAKTKNKTLILKLVFGLALLFFIGWKVYNEPVLENIKAIRLHEKAILLYIIFFMLMLLNWSIETFKWQFLMRPLKEMRFKPALLSVLAGISTGLMTPNRLGNFVGRTIYFEKEIKTEATLLTFHGNLAQFTATLIMGMVGLELFGTQKLSIQPVWLELGALFLILLAFLVYFKPTVVSSGPVKKWLGEDINKSLVAVQITSFKRKSFVLLLSLFRYFVFLIQFLLLLMAFNIDMPVIHLLAGISIVYLITTIVPSVLFGKLFVREASALFVLTSMGISSSVILLTVFILWLINLAIPSLLGALVLIRK